MSDIDRIIDGLPKKKVLKVNIDVLKDELNEVLERSEYPTELSDRFVSYSSILRDSQWTVRQYTKAVEYVTHRVAGDSMIGAYRKVFPERLDKIDNTVRASASIYDKGDLVQKIMAQVQIPIHITMMNERVKAAEILAYLMVNSDSEKIQMESADKLLNHIVAPEVVKVELDIGVKSDETIQNISESLDKLAQFAHSKIQSGVMTPLEVIES